ncbi:hypothetical protein CLOLEP_01519 [[Clostridium] leptum DSM 753]|uniref:Uncharacterized protein n=1 Tax=[Clostridium] leptum DSM 753 TaxID=428125 RepID=A7VSH9_9FIRM|nr:hypothetical protein CLOLEP_01519 [[Clostridium] leptum DSM 753]
MILHGHKRRAQGIRITRGVFKNFKMVSLDKKTPANTINFAFTGVQDAQ